MGRAEDVLGRPALLAIGLGAFLAQLDGTIMNVTLPALSHSFREPRLRSIQPVITAYLVASVVLLPILGKVADSLGMKRLFLAGFAIFGAASACCAISGSLLVLVVGRVVQASGGALLSGTGLALIAANAGPGRGRSLGRLSIVYALSGMVGPPLGGGLVQVFGWTSVFWLNVPLSLLGLAAAARFLPPDRRTIARMRPDIGGACLFAAATTMVAVGLSNATSISIDDYVLPGPFLVVLGLAMFALFYMWETVPGLTGKDPLLDVTLLTSTAYGIGLVAAFLSTGITIALFVLVPFWLSHGWNVSNGAIGLVFLPVAMGIGAFAPFAGKRSDVIGARALTTLGALTGAAGAVMLAWQATDFKWPVLMAAMFALGAGSGLFAAPNNNAVLSMAPESTLAVAGSMLSGARTLGVIVGISIGGSVFDTIRSAHGPNIAARWLFIGAGTVFIVNAVICWTARKSSARTDVQPLTRGRAGSPPHQFD